MALDKFPLNSVFSGNLCFAVPLQVVNIAILPVAIVACVTSYINPNFLFVVTLEV
jgi:hypothetical protein